MKRMGEKGKIILFLLIFFLTTPLVIFYSLEGLGVFDTRSQANFDWEKCPYSEADLDGDSKVGIGDFEVWLKEYRVFKEDPTTNGRMGDLDEDGKVRINDFAIWISLWREFKACQGNVMRCSPWCYASEKRVNFEESGTLHKCSDVPQIDIGTTPSKKEDCWVLGFSSIGVPSTERTGLQYLRLEFEEDSMCSFSNSRKEVCTYSALESYYSKSSGSMYASVEGYYEKGAPVKVSSMDISGTEDKCSAADEVVEASVGKTFQVSIAFGGGTPYHPYPPVYDNKVLKLVSESDAGYQWEQSSPETIIRSSGIRVYTFQALKPTYKTCTLIRLGLYHVHDDTDKSDEKTIAVFVTEGTVDPRFDVVDAKGYCDKIPGAKWLPAYSECELLGVANPQQYAGQCVKLGGVYDDCASACRHTVQKDMACIDVCVPLCAFGGGGSSSLQPSTL
jgi:hypothetical protein